MNLNHERLSVELIFLSQAYDRCLDIKNNCKKKKTQKNKKTKTNKLTKNKNKNKKQKKQGHFCLHNIVCKS